MKKVKDDEESVLWSLPFMGASIFGLCIVSSLCI